MRRTVLQTLTAAGLVLTAFLMADAAPTARRPPVMDAIRADGGDVCPALAPASADPRRGPERHVGAPRAAAMLLLLMPPRARLVLPE